MAQNRVGSGGDKFTIGNHFHEKILKLKDLMKTKIKAMSWRHSAIIALFPAQVFLMFVCINASFVCN